jgi:hypothetical protein
VSVAPCAAHCIDLCLEDIASFPSCKDMFKKITDVVKFFRGHTKLEQSFLRHSKGKKLILPASTRFKTNFITGTCALEQRDAMCQSMFDQPFKDLLKGRDTAVKAGLVKLHLKDDYFWQQLDALLKLTAPICDLLDYCNSQVCSLPSKLYLLKRRHHSLSACTSVSTLCKAKCTHLLQGTTAGKLYFKCFSVQQTLEDVELTCLLDAEIVEHTQRKFRER